MTSHFMHGLLVPMLLLVGCFATHETLDSTTSTDSTPPVQANATSLDVVLVTALRPTIDFEDVELVIMQERPPSFVVASYRTGFAPEGDEYELREHVIGSLEDLPAGEYRLQARLLDAANTVTLARNVIITLPILNGPVSIAVDPDCIEDSGQLCIWDGH